MSKLRPEIHLADLIRAFQVLKPDDETKPLLASMLGFEYVGGISTAPAPTDAKSAKRNKRSTQYKPKSRSSKYATDAAPNLLVEVVDESAPVKTPMMVLPKPFDESSEELTPAPKFFPLLAPIWTRAIITKMLSRDANYGLPDISKIIDIISANQPLDQIPRQPLPTIRNGVQILIDNGPGLVPFLRDQIFFLEELKLVVGADKVDVWEFIGTPLKHAVSGREPNLPGYRLPAPGVPLLLLTDLGIAAPPFEVEVATVDEWLSFIQEVSRSGHQMLTLTPYHPARCPAQLKSQMAIIQWDRGTSVSAVLRAIS
ncbi:MAG TPA: hypothetical protein VFI24_07410 [Pyrinomonadaceae bacterium]|nr:hypothetical protein [Pyrinomonadaceae bacterium]